MYKLSLLGHFLTRESFFAIDESVEALFGGGIVYTFFVTDEHAKVVGWVLFDQNGPAIKSVINHEGPRDATCYLDVEDECLVGGHDSKLGLRDGRWQVVANPHVSQVGQDR